MTMKQLPAATIKLITSTQVITSTSSAVKELVENSLDAKSSSIEIKLENYGLDKIELRDNGCGVPREDVTCMAQSHYTSKLKTTEDLDSLETYGFRGEALGSLCAVAEVKITTKTPDEDISREYTLDLKGQVLNSKPSHVGQGTTVTVSNLFKNIPVRKQYQNNAKRKKETLKQVEDLVVSFGIICPDVRFVLRHNREVVWQKNVVPHSKDVLRSVLGSAVMNQLQHVQKTSTEAQFELECFLPKMGSNSTETGRTSTEKTFVYVNHRPVIMKDIEKILKQHYSSSHNLDHPKYPVGFVSIKTPSKDVDVNVDPNKTQVMIHNKDELHKLLEDIFHELYKKEDKPDINSGDTDDICNGAIKVDHSTSTEPALPTLSHHNTEPINEVSSTLHMDSACRVTDLNAADQNKDLFHDESMEDIFDSLDGTLFKDVNADLTHVSSVGVDGDNSCVVGNNRNEKADNTDMTRLNSRSDDVEDSDINLPIDAVLTSTNKNSEHGIGITNKLDFDVSGDLDELLAMDIDTPVKATYHSGDDTEKFKDMGDVRQVGDSGRDWSKGSALINRQGTVVQPVQLLLPTRTNQSALTSKDESCNVSEDTSGIDNSKLDTSRGSSSLVTTKSASILESPGQPTLYDIVGGHTIKKPTTSYIYFSKEVRQQVIKDNPHSSFQDIARIIGQKWRELSDAEKEIYEQLWTKDVARYKAQKDQISSLEGKMQSAKKKRKVEAGDRSIQQLFSPVNNKSHSKNKKSPSKHQQTPAKSVTVQFSVERLKTKMAENEKYDNSQQWETPYRKLHLIGQIPHQLLWVGCQGSKIILFQPIRAKELLIYQSLLETHAVPLEPLENPIQLTQSNIAEWSSLMSMTTSQPVLPDPYTYFTDHRLVNSGFKIRTISAAEAGSVKVEIVSMTKCMSFFGVSDLGEILERVSENINCPLQGCRPAKIQHYLQAEAVRMSRRLPPTCTKQECHDILLNLTHSSRSSPSTSLYQDIQDSTSYSSIKFNQSGGSGKNCCFHNKPYLLSVYDMEELPCTQLTQTQDT